MNKLCRHAHTYMSEALNKVVKLGDEYHLLSKYDRVVATTYALFRQDKEWYDGLPTSRQVQRWSPDYLPHIVMWQKLAEAYLNWLETLQPHDLESVFNEHEIMELFTGEEE